MRNLPIILCWLAMTSAASAEAIRPYADGSLNAAVTDIASAFAASKTVTYKIDLVLGASGIGIVQSTQDADHTFSVASCGALMRQRNITALGTTQEVMSSADLSNVYCIDVSITSERSVAVPCKN